MSIYNSTVLVIYNKLLAQHQQVAALAAILLECPTATVLDIQGTTSGDIDTAITAIAASTYDDVIVLADIASTATSSKISYDQLVALRLKLKVANQGTSILTGTVGTTGSTTQIAFLETVGADTTDYYAGLFLNVTAGTHAGVIKKIISYNKTGKLASVGGAAVSGAYDNTDVYTILNVPHLCTVQDTALSIATAFLYDTVVTTSNIVARTWNYIHSVASHPMPMFLRYIANKYYAVDSGTSSSGAATKINDTAKTFVVNSLVGYYVFRPATAAGKGEYARIASNTATDITCDVFNGFVQDGVDYGNAAWTVNPSTDIYYIVSKYKLILLNAYAQLYLKTYLLDATAQASLIEYKKLIDSNSKLHTYPYGSPVVDELFEAAILAQGKNIFDAVKQTVTLT